MNPKIRLACDYIPDKKLASAVLFAVRMMRQGTYAPLANARAAKYYGVKTADVAFYTGQHSSRIKESRRGRRRNWAGGKSQ